MANGGSGGDEKRGREGDEAGSETANRGDLEGVLEFYAEDGSVVWPEAPAAHGHDGIRAALKAMFEYCQGLKLRFDPERIEIAKSADIATDYGAVNFKYTDPT